MSIILDGIPLPADLEWQDEYSQSLVKSTSRHGMTGALIIQQGLAQSGRPMTLFGGPSGSWIKKSTLDLLRAKVETPSLEMTLDYKGTSMQVMFSRDTQSPVNARTVSRTQDNDGDPLYTVIIKLIEV